ncbi:hypothetical protein LCGC14_2280920 [marine sediment metagenome]|uniref:Uncharacterized protein n=1 Tax=marine sediment metagenome TaxID=412755 RepID=A0A0F9DGH5_9ZZZZ
MIRVIQDGPLFYDYDDDSGGRLFASNILVVSDTDMVAACAARLQFELWAQEQNLEVEFVR